MPQLQRTETPARFKTNVTRQVVAALRDTIVTHNLWGTDFPRGINVVNSYPLTEIDYPAIVVQFMPSVNETAGVGHEEWFADLDGNMRSWQHRKFEGSVQFTAVALDPLERDILADCLVDILTFSHFSANESLAAFFTDMQQTPDAIGTVFQTNLDSDRIVPGGVSTSVAPWEPEDVLLYEEVYTVACMGGYYNTVLVDWPGYIMHVGIDSPFMESFAADVVLPPPSETPSPVQTARGFDHAVVTMPSSGYVWENVGTDGIAAPSGGESMDGTYDLGIDGFNSNDMLRGGRLGSAEDPVYLAYNGGNFPYNFYCREWNGVSWSDVGEQPITAIVKGNGNGIDVAVSDLTGDVYVAFSGDNSNPHKIHVLKWNGATWTELGTGIQDGSHSAYFPRIALNKLTDDLVVIGEIGVNSNQEAWHWNGSAWTQMGTLDSHGGGSFTYAGYAYDYPSGDLYVSYEDDADDPGVHYYVMKWVNPNWELVATIDTATFDFNNPPDAGYADGGGSQLTFSDGHLYLSIAPFNEDTFQTDFLVFQYDGAGGWTQLDTNVLVNPADGIGQGNDNGDPWLLAPSDGLTQIYFSGNSIVYGTKWDGTHFASDTDGAFPDASPVFAPDIVSDIAPKVIAGTEWCAFGDTTQIIVKRRVPA